MKKTVKSMKKLIAISSCVLMLGALTLTGCGEKKDEKKDETKTENLGPAPTPATSTASTDSKQFGDGTNDKSTTDNAAKDTNMTPAEEQVKKNNEKNAKIVKDQNTKNAEIVEKQNKQKKGEGEKPKSAATQGQVKGASKTKPGVKKDEKGLEEKKKEEIANKLKKGLGESKDKSKKEDSKPEIDS